MKKYDIVKMTRGEIAQYMDDQVAMMNEINARAAHAQRKAVFDNPRADALRYEIVRVGDNYKLTKRERPLDIFDDDGNIGITMAERTVSEKMGLDRSITRGKYNDSMRLLGEDTASIELNEVQMNGGGGYGRN